MSWTPTPEQRAIIAHDPTSNGRVLAGPGTGKSATVIRMMLGMADDGVGRGKLLTFTRAATNELKEKVAEHPEALESPSTIHSFAISRACAETWGGGWLTSIRISTCAISPCSNRSANGDAAWSQSETTTSRFTPSGEHIPGESSDLWRTTTPGQPTTPCRSATVADRRSSTGRDTSSRASQADQCAPR